MKTARYSSLLLSIGLLLTQCTLDPECTWEDLYPEFESYVHFDDVEGTDLTLIGPEFDPSINLYTGYVIRTDSAYDALTAFSIDENCPFCIYPEIDFSQYTLVGFPLEISCLATNYVKLSATSDGWQYSLKTADQTQCNQLLCDNFGFNWILMPKSADTTNIAFEAGVARYFCDC